MVRAIDYLAKGPELEENRFRGVAITSLIVAGIAVSLLVVPVPLATKAEGVVWLPEQGRVRVETSGIVQEVFVAPGSPVSAGEPLLRMVDPFLETEVAVHTARLKELRARRAAELFSDTAKSGLTQSEIEEAEAELDHARARRDGLLVRSPSDGEFVVPGGIDLLGRYLAQGEEVGYVLTAAPPRVRLAVGQDSMGLVREGVRQVTVRLAERPGEPISARVTREVPGGENRLPSRALGEGGGGRIAVDPGDADGLSTRQNTFQLELLLPSSDGPARAGGRVYVHLDHGMEPLAWQWLRRGRQLFLRQLGV
jgi:putative peptide zinc metalloprotease protein